MDQNKNDIELLHLTVKGIADEQLKLNQKMQELIDTNNQMRSDFSASQEKPEHQTITVSPPDIKPFTQRLENGIERIGLLISEKLNKRKLDKLETFLQSDAKKWIVILLLGFAFLTYLYMYLTRH